MFELLKCSNSKCPKKWDCDRFTKTKLNHSAYFNYTIIENEIYCGGFMEKCRKMTQKEMEKLLGLERVDSK